MDPNHLKLNELNYELKIRGLEISGTVEVKRKILRGSLNQENANRSFSGTCANPYSFDDDVKEMKDTVSDLQSVIDNFSGSKEDPSFKRISSRLAHLSNRYQRLKVDTDEHEKYRKDLQYLILGLEADFDLKLSPSSSTPINVSPPVQINPQPRSVAPYKWNIFFTGSDHNESVNSFLEKIESLREARNISKDELFHSACDLFKGSAWTWFLSNKHRVNSWDELVQKLKQDFLPYFYDEDLEREINSRTQGSNERVALYISAMEALFNRLSKKPDELVIVNKIRRNLLPFYISNLALHEPKTIVELSDLCRKLEESHLWSERYKPPPRNGILEPDLSCPSGSSTFFPKNYRMSKNLSSNISVLSNIKCWNCDMAGHSYSQCQEKKILFCYGCGNKNTVKPKCVKCNPKNLPSRNRNLDAVSCQNIQGPELNQPSTSQTNTSNKKKKGKQSPKRNPQ